MNRTTISVAALLPLLLLAGCCGPNSWPFNLEAPTTDHLLTVNVDSTGTPFIELRRGQEAIARSAALGLTFEGNEGIGGPVQLLSHCRDRGVEKYSPLVGKSSEVELAWNELLLDLRDEDSGIEYKLRLRSTDEGVAFRYELKSLPDDRDTVRIIAERTAFRFPDASHAWAKSVPSWTTASEYRYLETLIGELDEAGQIGLPLLLIRQEGSAILLHEAALVDYAGMNLKATHDSTGTVLQLLLAPNPNPDEPAVVTDLPMKTPWRILLLADHPGEMIESEMIPALNNPCKINDPSWIEPGLASWDWWSGQIVEGAAFKTGSNDSTLRAYVDLAAEYGWRYALVDAGWYGRAKDLEADITKPLPQIDIPGLVEYASERDVGILLWVHWKNTRRQMKEAFPLYEQWGVNGVKVDYMNRRDQEMVRFYHDLLALAAKHHLVVDLHGSYMPTGIRRTWPNLLTREGVLGLEHLKEPGRIPYADHNLVLPYTRMVIGPMDYTPGGFRSVTPEEFIAREVAPLVPTTTAQQLAMFVVYDSPLQMVSDSPGSVRNDGGSDMLKTVPASWDEVRFLGGEIGKSILLARRSGEVWWIGAMAGNEPYETSVELSGLFSKASPESLLVTRWMDGASGDPCEVIITSAPHSRDDAVDLTIPASGGAVLKIEVFQ